MLGGLFMEDITLKIPASIIAKVELLSQIDNKNFNELVIELLESYIDNKLYSLTHKKEAMQMSSNTKKDITLPMIETAYQVAKEVYRGNITRTEGKEKVNQLSGMGIGSAQDYITIFLSMMSGDRYARTMSTMATDYFLRNIYNDFGAEQFKIAVSATRKHLDYYSTVSSTSSPKRRNLLEKLEIELL